MNQITLLGRNTRDIEVRTHNGRAVTNFTLAVDRNFLNKDGERVTDFIDCSAWGPTADFIGRNFSKGQLMAVSGELQIRTSVSAKSGEQHTNAQVMVSTVSFAGYNKPSDMAIATAAIQEAVLEPVPAAPKARGKKSA